MEIHLAWGNYPIESVPKTLEELIYEIEKIYWEVDRGNYMNAAFTLCLKYFEKKSDSEREKEYSEYKKFVKRYLEENPGAPDLVKSYLYCSIR